MKRQNVLKNKRLRYDNKLTDNCEHAKHYACPISHTSNMKLKSTRYFLSMLTVIYVFTACSQPVPPEKRNYVGEWRSKEMYLLILADGSVKYKRLKRGVSTKMTGPIKEFQGDNFVVGIAFMTTTFEVSKPPFQHNGVWYMVVDGVALRKINSPFFCNDEVKIGSKGV
jgi:hypothetical protein